MPNVLIDGPKYKLRNIPDLQKFERNLELQND